jgi:hypothetical protein
MDVEEALVGVQVAALLTAFLAPLLPLPMLLI